MEDYGKTRELIQRLANTIKEQGKEIHKDLYYVFTDIIDSMAIEYNLQEEEIQKQLEMILKAYIKTYNL